MTDENEKLIGVTSKSAAGGWGLCVFVLLAAGVGLPGCSARRGVEVRHEQMTLPWYVSEPLYKTQPRAFIPMARERGTVRRVGERTFDIIVLENEYLTVHVAPEINGAVVRAIYRPTGEDLLFFEGKAKDWLPFWESGVKASFPFREHGMGTVQPASWHIRRGKDGSVTVAMWMEFSRHNEAYNGSPYGRHSTMMLSQLVTLRPGEGTFAVKYRLTNPTPYRQGRQLWNDALFPRNQTAEGVIQGPARPPIPSPSELIYPAAYVSGHAGKDFRKFDEAMTPVAQYKSHISIFSWGIGYGFAGVWYPDVRVNRLRITDPVAAPGAKVFLSGDGRYWPGGLWTHMHNFAELWGGFDSLFEGVENWIGPGQAWAFEHRFALVRGIGKVDYADANVAVNVALAGDADKPRLVEAVTLRPVRRLQATWDGRAIGASVPCAPDLPARFPLPAGANSGRLRLVADGRVMLDQQFPLPIPDDKSRHAAIRRSVDTRSAEYYEMTDNSGPATYRKAIGKYGWGSVSRGRVLYRDGLLSRAALCLLVATATSPGDGEAWHLLGATLLEQGHTGRAKTALDGALAAKQPYPPAGYLRAVIALGEGQADRAGQLLADLIKADPRNWQGSLLKAWVDAGHATTARQALGMARRLEAEDPADPRAKWVLARCARAAGNAREAERMDRAMQQLLREPGVKRRLAEFQAATRGRFMPATRLRHFGISEFDYWAMREFVIRIDPLFVSGDTFGGLDTKILLSNRASVPLKISWSFAPHPTLRPVPAKTEVQVPPKSTKTIDLHLRVPKPVAVGDLPPLKLSWSAAYVTEGGENHSTKGVRLLRILRKFDCPRRKGKVVVDGKLDEWGQLPIDVAKPAQILNDRKAHTGPGDCSFRFATAHDDKYLYVAIEVTDDKSYLHPDKAVWRQDGVEVRLNAAARPDRSRSGKDILLIAVSPPTKGRPMVMMHREQLPADTKVVSVRTATGHVTEIAIPIAYLNAKAGGRWKEFRLNVAVNDYDTPDKGAQLWWRPDWRSGQTYPGSGTFQRR